MPQILIELSEYNQLLEYKKMVGTTRVQLFGEVYFRRSFGEITSTGVYITGDKETLQPAIEYAKISREHLGIISNLTKEVSELNFENHQLRKKIKKWWQRIF